MRIPRKAMTLISTAALSAATTCGLAIAAEAPVAVRITPEVREQVLKGITDALTEGYVFPEVAAKTEREIRERTTRGEYASYADGAALAEKLTNDLQAISRDKHLRVRFSAEPLPQFANREPSGEELKRMREGLRKRNAGFVRVERLPGNIGYLDFRAFTDVEVAERPIAAAMSFVADTDALIIDLRKNGGGHPATVALLCSYFFGETPVHLNSLYWRQGDRTEEFWTRKELDGPRYLEREVYLLTSRATFSGAEEFCYNLQNLKRATLIGETTGGGAHPGGAVRVHDHFAVFVPMGRAINPITKTNWEGTGVTPDIAVPAENALQRAHRLAADKILARVTDETTRELIREEIARAESEKE